MRHRYPRSRWVGRLAVVAAVMLATPASASADAVVDWNIVAEGTLFLAAGQPEQAAVLELAMVQGAVYDAANAIDGTSYKPYLDAPPAHRRDSMDAAVAAAAYGVLASLVPSHEPALQARYQQSLAAIPDGGSKLRGIAVGERAAVAMIQVREDDGRDASVPPPVFGSQPGQWRPTPPGLLGAATPWIGAVRPFVVESVDKFRSRGPRNLTGAAYAREFNEIKAVGSQSSTSRTPDQTDAALFWAGLPWASIVRSLVASHQLDTADAARLLAMATLAAADGVIACYDDKYHWKYWRPVTAIHEAATDENPATQPDPTWTPLLTTPNHPDHPSGHACASGAVGTTIKRFFHTDRVAFRVVSPVSRTSRSFNSISQALEEVEDARVWAGIHFRTADVQGERIGRQVARYMTKHHFRPAHRRHSRQNSPDPRAR